LWHELVLHGIGGRTVAEAQARMSYAEALQWQAYRQKRGTLNDGLRIEVGFGQLLAMVAQACGNKGVTAFDFMPHVERPPQKVQTFEEIVAVLRSVAPRKKQCGPESTESTT
jgi:hypothetical protein